MTECSMLTLPCSWLSLRSDSSFSMSFTLTLWHEMAWLTTSPRAEPSPQGWRGMDQGPVPAWLGARSPAVPAVVPSALWQAGPGPAERALVSTPFQLPLGPVEGALFWQAGVGEVGGGGGGLGAWR